MIVEKTLKELYKKSAYIDDLFGLLWESLKEESEIYRDKEEFLSALKKKEKEQIIHSIISGFQKQNLFEDSNIEENSLLDFLLDTPKNVLIDFLSNEILEHIHSNQDILILVLDSVNSLKPDPDKLVEENGSYTDMMFVLEVIGSAYKCGYFDHFEIKEKDVIKWLNDMPAGGIEFLRLKSWRIMKAMEKNKSALNF